ncbi:MAG: hypothetical protein HOE54_07240, partial [Gammaproteobacteria bacterium]|nr:hypothetical protein [Gammaproteobacteria bacterium]
MRTLSRIHLVFFSLLAFPILAEQAGQPIRVTQVEMYPIKRVVSTYGILAPKIEDLSFRIGGR